MNQKVNIILIVSALAALLYFIYELIALPRPTSVGYACLFLGSIINVYRILKNKRSA